MSGLTSKVYNSSSWSVFVFAQFEVLVAYKRFSDNIPLAIDDVLVRGLERDVLQALYMGLGVNGPDGHRICQELAQESPQVADRRMDLAKKLERLESASEELLSIGH